METLVTTTTTKAPPKRVLWRWRVWAGLMLGMVVLSEVVLRSVFGFAHPILYQVDSACGYLPKPSQNVTRFFSLNYVNRYGMRSPEIQTPKPAHSFRLLCIGDSVTYGTTFVPQDQIFTSRLAQALPEVLHEPAEVLNASAGGWAPGNEWGFLKSRGTLDADLVLFVWNAGDLFQAFNDFPADSNYPTSNPPTAIGEVWGRYVSPRLFRGAQPTPDKGSQAAAEDVAQSEANLEILKQAAAFAHEGHAAFGVVFVPCPSDSFQTSAYERARENLRSFVQHNKIPMLDLTESFKGGGWMGLTKDGIHLRSSGHEVVANEFTKGVEAFISEWRTRNH